MRRRLVLLSGVGVLVLGSPGAAAAKTHLPAFRSPSGNIECFYGSSVLHCQIGQADYAKTLQDRCMAGPSVDWHGFELGATRKSALTCSGGILYDPDTQVPYYVTLAYGKSRRLGGVTCSSAVTGVTCRNRAGHGLFISRQSWRAW